VPELPDVEGFRRYLARFAEGRPIEAVEVIDADLVRNTTAQGLGRALRGRHFEGPKRHGKWLIAPAGRAELLMHFGMTGLLKWASDSGKRSSHDRVVFRFPGGELRYRNQRKFGGIWLARSDAEREKITGPLGPDAMALGREQFAELLGRRRGRVKPALMDQKLLAGVGNLLSDEILWRARINPRLPVQRLSGKRRDAIYDVMQDVLRRSNRRGRVPPDRSWLTGVRNDRDAACPRCGTRLRRATIGGRTACWCPRCQRGTA
jgi:formamidopyrimidine-DNA glycosylase